MLGLVPSIVKKERETIGGTLESIMLAKVSFPLIKMQIGWNLISVSVGIHDDGDIFRYDNLTEFRRFVMENTGNRGVHFVMGDGVCYMLWSFFFPLLETFSFDEFLLIVVLYGH